MKKSAFFLFFKRLVTSFAIFLLSVLIFSGNASAQTNLRVLTAVKRAVGNSGFSVATIGSWLSSSYIEGVSDQDMRLIKPDNIKGDANLQRAWEKARFEIREEIIKEFGHSKADEILKKTNLYPPNELMEGVSGPKQAAEKFKNLGSVPNLGYESGQKISEDALKNASEGLYGKGAQTYQQAYEKGSGKLIYCDNGKVREGFLDLTHISEGRGVYTIEGTANTAAQWAGKLDEALEIKNPKAVNKYFERMRDDIVKSKSLAGANTGASALDETMEKLAKCEREALEEACAPIKDRIIKQLEGLSHYGKLSSEGKGNLLVSEMKKALTGDAAIQSAYMDAYGSKVFGDNSLIKVIKESAENAKIDSHLLKTFAATDNPREISTIIKLMEGAETKYTNFKTKLVKLSEKIPFKYLIPAAVGLFAYIQTADIASSAGRENYEKAFSDMLVSAGFTGSLGVGVMQMIVQSLLDSAKEFGYDIALRQQDCEDMIAGLYEVKGREDVESKAEFSLERLAFEADSEESVRRIVETQAYNATMRGLGDATKKVDEAMKDKLYNKCVGCILERWSAKRETVITRTAKMSRNIYRKTKFALFTVEINPQNPILTKEAGENVNASVEFLFSAVNRGADIEADIKKLEETLRWLGGKTPEAAALLASSTCRWYWGDKLISTQKNIGKELFFFKNKFPFANAGVYKLRTELELELTVASSLDDLSRYAGTISKKIGRKIDFEVEIRPADTNEIKVSISGDKRIFFGEPLKLTAKTTPDAAAQPLVFEWQEKGVTIEKGKELLIMLKEPGQYYYNLILYDDKGKRLAYAEHTVDVIKKPETADDTGSDKTADAPIIEEKINETETVPTVPDAPAEQGGPETTNITESAHWMKFQISAPDCWKIFRVSTDVKCEADMNLERHVAALRIEDLKKEAPKTPEKKGAGNNKNDGKNKIIYDTGGEEKDDPEPAEAGEFSVNAEMHMYVGTNTGVKENGDPISIGDFKGKLLITNESGSEKAFAVLASPDQKSAIFLNYKITWGLRGKMGLDEGKQFIENHKNAARSEIKAMIASMAISNVAKITKFPYSGPAFGPGYKKPVDDYPILGSVRIIPQKKADAGDEFEFLAECAGFPAGEEPKIFEWTRMNFFKEDKPSLTVKSNPCKMKLDKNVSWDIEVSAYKSEGAPACGYAKISYFVKGDGKKEEEKKGTVEIIKTSPGNNTLAAGSSASFSAKVAGDSDKIIFRWQPHPEVAFNPFEGASKSTTAKFDKPGKFKIWVEALESKDGALKTIGTSGQIEIEVLEPSLKISVNPARVMVGEPAKAVVAVEPQNLKDIDFRWELPSNVKLIEESKDKTSISFNVIDDKPAAIKVSGRAPVSGEPLGNAEANISASLFKTSVSLIGTDGPKPRIWKEGKLVEVENEYAVFQNIRLEVKISPEATKIPLKYEWSVNQDSHFAGNSITKVVSVNRSRVGECAAKVIVKNADGILIGEGSGGFDVKISQEDMKKSADKNDGQKDKKTDGNAENEDKKKAEEEKETAKSIEKMIDLVKVLLESGNEDFAKATTKVIIDKSAEQIKKTPEKKSYYSGKLNELKTIIEDQKLKTKAKEDEKARLAKEKAEQEKNRLDEENRKLKEAQALAEKQKAEMAQKQLEEEQRRLAEENRGREDAEKARQAEESAEQEKQKAAQQKEKEDEERRQAEKTENDQAKIKAEHDRYSQSGLKKLKAKDYRGSFDDYTTAINAYPDDPKDYNNRGNARKNLNDYDGAREDYITAIKLKPDYDMAKRNLERLEIAIREKAQRQNDEQQRRLDEENRGREDAGKTKPQNENQTTSYAGTYKGSYSGSRSGPVLLKVDSNGKIEIFFIDPSIQNKSLDESSISTTGKVDESGNFSCGSSGYYVSGSFSTSSSCSGNWQGEGFGSGNWSARKK